MTATTTAELFDCARLISAFERCFAASENTRLMGGAAEPLYLPAAQDRPQSLLYFREDYFASALHETAHWCIAGRDRRKLQDFGYWYAPEGRSVAEQCAFEAVEIKPQALEWIFSLACGYRFQVSVDNFGEAGELRDSSGFARAVARQARQWQQTAMPARATVFYRALSAEFDTQVRFQELQFEPGALN